METLLLASLTHPPCVVPHPNDFLSSAENKIVCKNVSIVFHPQ